MSWKKMMYTLLISQIIVILYLVLSSPPQPIVTFINTNFYIGISLLILGLFVMISTNGFFDVITDGFRHVFFRSQVETNTDSYRPFSQLVGSSYLWMIISGLFLIVLSLIALYFQY